MLADRLDYYKQTGKKLNNTPAQYKNEFSWLKEVDSLALANAQLNLNKAYSNFFSNRKHFRKPRFKSKKQVILLILPIIKTALSDLKTEK